MDGWVVPTHNHGTLVDHVLVGQDEALLGVDHKAGGLAAARLLMVKGTGGGHQDGHDRRHGAAFTDWP